MVKKTSKKKKYAVVQVRRNTPTREDRLEMLLEAQRDGFRAFGESLSGVHDKLDEHSAILNEHSRILDEHSVILGEHTRKLDENSMRLDNVERNLGNVERSTEEMQSELSFIRHTMITREEVRLLEVRVSRLEKLHSK